MKCCTDAITAMSLAIAINPPRVSADAICSLPSCPAAPLPGAGPFPAPISVAEAQNLFLSLPVVPGDVNLLDVGGSIGDVLRFSSDGLVFLFSDNPGTEPSDVGIPPNGPNVFAMPEAAETPPFVVPKYTTGAPSSQTDC